MDFFEKTGKMAIGSRLRMLSERLTDEATAVYRSYGVDLKPKWFPVFFVLSQGEAKTVTALAEEIGHTHPSVSKIVREMAKGGLVEERKDKRDGRKNVISLSEKGRAVQGQLADQYADVNQAIEHLLAQTRHDLWKALEEWEFLLSQQSLFRRVQACRKEREARNVQIVPYEPNYQEAFRSLNEAWISAYFTMEPADYKALDHPQEYILDRGGHILVALYNDEPLGVCALIPMDDPDYEFELAKMAVSPRAQGKGLGWLLGQAVVDKARLLGATKLYLESNTRLEPAISLYHKLGFQKVVGHPTPYERSNIQMELILTP
ncbi:DNA-binding transcriptional regulator, MarR family [Catalinimonas alkaloidigena]|uniref:DNA-binding transcriptional regulator, MarR family n=1 Tax=Catalinimonas alkaloidigena TaxID=1075417 RepID=A0A1G9ADH2_9BACT|nr:GNAT family N-acetyltransferase [Catalinimonas alkaloidigena]SDK24854.1 DNA-binding transcriptional regulator, MarR family [Catalinimonas alkaloidigena]